MAEPKLSDGTDELILNFNGEYSGPIAEQKRAEVEIPKKQGNPQQYLGRGNRQISGTVNLTVRSKKNGSEVGDAQVAADLLKEWHNNNSSLTWTNENGETMSVNLTITGHTKTQTPSTLQRMDIELTEEVN